MKSSYDTSVRTPVDALWAQLIDIDRLVTVLPDVGLTPDGDSLVGSLKCKLGSHQVTYRIVVRASVTNGSAKVATIEISGTEARGDGSLDALLTVAAHEVGDQTRVELGGDVEATGRGEGADARAWARVMESYLTAVLPVEAVVPDTGTETVPDVAPTTDRSSAKPVAVPPLETTSADEVAQGPSVPTGPIALAAALLVMLLLMGRRRWRRRRQ